MWKSRFAAACVAGGLVLLSWQSVEAKDPLPPGPDVTIPPSAPGPFVPMPYPNFPKGNEGKDGDPVPIGGPPPPVVVHPQSTPSGETTVTSPYIGETEKNLRQ